MSVDPLAVGSPSLLTAAMLRWFQQISVQGILTTDTDLVIRSWNRCLEEHTGRAASEVIGRPLLEVVPELASRGLDEYFRSALAGQPRVLSHRFHRYLIPGRPGAPEKAQSAQIAPLEADGVIVGTIAVVDDVSERVASERVLKSRRGATSEAGFRRE